MENSWENSTLMSSENFTGSSNSTLSQHSFVNPFDKIHIRIIFCILYSLTFVCCFFGNSLVLFIIIRNARMRTRTNFFLANLAAADFCVGVFCVFPNLSIYISPIWHFGRAMCKIYYFTHYMSLTVPVLLLTVISVERYVAILHPLKAKQLFTVRRLRLVQLFIWLLLTVYNLPQLIHHDTVTFGNYTYCYMMSDGINSSAYVLANIIVWYIIPLSVIMYMYVKISKVLWRSSSVSQNFALITNPKINAKQRDRNGGFDNNTCDGGSYLNVSNSGKDAASRHIPMHEISLQKEDMEIVDISHQRGLINQRKHHVDSMISEPETEREYLPDIDFQIESEGNSDVYSVESSVRGMGSPTITFKERKTIRDSLQIITVPRVTVSDSNNARFGSITTTTTTATAETTATDATAGRHHIIDQAPINTQKVIQARKKIILLLVMIISSFAVLALPYHIRSCLYMWVDTTSLESLFSPICYLLYYANSGLNPVLYALLSDNFRRGFKDSFKCL